jgi:hypothetical protein
VPQSYELGQEAQVDWFEGMAKLGSEVVKLQFFAMRSMGSGDAFHRVSNFTHILSIKLHFLDYVGTHYLSIL